tara:strand:- start:2074 stop:2592 length:519 start_codon:yes stop_codon:yes gene_type:complete
LIEPEWARIAGLHVTEEGSVGVVWVALNPQNNTLTIYDCSIFDREVLAVIAEGLKGKDTWIPVAWPKSAQELSKKLLDRGCKMLYEACDESQASIEITSREIEERMRTKKLKVGKELKPWLDEYKTYYRQDSQIPKNSHPLMAATRNAISRLDSAKKKNKSQILNYPKINVL